MNQEEMDCGASRNERGVDRRALGDSGFHGLVIFIRHGREMPHSGQSGDYYRGSERELCDRTDSEADMEDCGLTGW